MGEISEKIPVEANPFINGLYWNTLGRYRGDILKTSRKTSGPFGFSPHVYINAEVGHRPEPAGYRTEFRIGTRQHPVPRLHPQTVPRTEPLLLLLELGPFLNIVPAGRLDDSYSSAFQYSCSLVMF